MTYTARINWKTLATTQEPFNMAMARLVEVFGLPGGRYTTLLENTYLDINFINEQDRLMFLTGWPAYIPKEAS